MFRFRKLAAVLCLIVSLLMLAGCKAPEKTDIEKLSDVEFTVVPENEVPEELLKIIEEKKENPFKLTYYTKDKVDLYIVVGYGKQPTGGYSIAVEELFLTNNAVYIDTNLVGPAQGDVVTQAITYPFVVVKIEYTEKPVTFV